MNWLKDSAAACTACKDMVFKIFIYVTDDIKKSLLVADSLSSMEQSIALKYRLLQLNLSIQFTHFEIKGVIVTVITMWLSVYSSIFLIARNSVIFLHLYRSTNQFINHLFYSGLLVSYLSFRRMEKSKGQLPLFQFYFHRFWR